MALFRINMQTMELDSYSVSLATVVRALLLNDWKGKSAALPGHCPGGPVPAAAYAWASGAGNVKQGETVLTCMQCNQN